MVPGIPGMRLPPKEHRPPVSNPPPREIADSLTGDVHASYGAARFKGPAWVFLALLVAALIGGNIYFASRRQPEDPTGIAHDVRAELYAQTEEVRKLGASLTDRIDKLDTRLGRIEDSEDRLRQRVKAVEENPRP
jgi:hypothetical protein